jgi:hypothetical protein
MLKKSASGVLAGHCRLTISAAFTNVPCLIRHGVNLRGSTYRSVRFAPSLAAALLDGLFEPPEVILGVNIIRRIGIMDHSYHTE